MQPLLLSIFPSCRFDCRYLPSNLAILGIHTLQGYMVQDLSNITVGKRGHTSASTGIIAGVYPGSKRSLDERSFMLASLYRQTSLSHKLACATMQPTQREVYSPPHPALEGLILISNQHTPDLRTESESRKPNNFALLFHPDQKDWSLG